MKATISPIKIGTDRQLFVDHFLIAEMRGLAHKLHSPIRREKVILLDRPWEGPLSALPVVIKDGERYRMWYRATQPFPAAHYASEADWNRAANKAALEGSWTAYAESQDGIHWEKPSLGLTEYRGSTDNNLVWRDRTKPGYEDYCVFKDPNPDVPEDERYKSIIELRYGDGSRRQPVYGIVSSDGLRWRLVQDEPLIPPIEGERSTDGPHVVFWDPWQSCYAIYRRGWWGENRCIRRSTSTDFRHWTTPEFVDIHFGAEPREQFYTSGCMPYLRAPGIYLMFPKRFVLERQFFADWPQSGQSDIGFLSSRDGVHWDRTFREAFIRPGLDPNIWHERSISSGSGIVETGSDELSMYLWEGFRTEEAHVRRVTLRPDGFVSINAPDLGGELITRQLIFAGRQLAINYSTSATGSVRVEMLNSFGRPVEGYTLAESTEIFGDELDRVVTWSGNSDIGRLAGEPIRLRFVMRDADLYAFRFAE